MKIIRKSSEDEMLLEYLKAEINSKRFSERLEKTLIELSLSQDIILNGNLENEQENKQRKLIMEKFRGYPTEDIFERFPKEFNWFYVQFEEGDIDKIFYLNWEYWNEISNNTSKPTEAAKNIYNGVEIYDISNEPYFKGLEYLKSNNKFNPIIALTCNGEKFVLIEGHSRMTVYGMKPKLFAGTFGYIGYCSKKEMAIYDSRMI
ncbi:MAG: hypothetical protein IJ690_06130 [Clostridia bacterium]|nr:hypothetical protein [Clostridia bacterium]